MSRTKSKMNYKDILYKQRIIAKDFKSKWISNMSLDLKDYLSKYSKQDLVTKIPELFQVGKYNQLLNNLWDGGFRLGDSTSKSTPTFNLSDSLVDFAEYDTRRRNVKGKYRAESQGISTGEFGKTYLKYRNQKIFSNFVPQYRQTIKASIKKYVESPNPDESALYDALKPQYIKDKNIQELQNYAKVKSVDKQFMEGEGLQVGDMGGLLKRIKENPSKYDKTGYFLDMNNRVDRIAQTEVSQAYNLGVIAKSVEKGARYFMWNNSLESRANIKQRCKLCASLHGKIVDMSSSVIASGQSWNTDFKNLPPNYTRRTIFELPELMNSLGGILHPFCGCFFTVLDSKEAVTKTMATITGNKANTQNEINQVMQSVGLSEEQKQNSLVTNILSAALVGTVAVKGVDVAKQLSVDLVLEHRKKEEQRRKQKMIIIGSSILATGMMMYFFYKTSAKLKTNILDDIVEEIIPTQKLGAKIAKSIEAAMDTAKDMADELAENIVEEIAEEFVEGVEESMDKLELEALYKSTLQSIIKATSVLVDINTSAQEYIKSTKMYLNQWSRLIFKIRSDKFEGFTNLEDNFNLKSIREDIVNKYAREHPNEYLQELSKLRSRIQKYINELVYIEDRLKQIDYNIKQERLSVLDRDTFLISRMTECRNKLSEGSEVDVRKLAKLEIEFENYSSVRKQLDVTYKGMARYVSNKLSLTWVLKAAEDISDITLLSMYATDKQLKESLSLRFNELFPTNVNT
jgi:hypothetical protein